MQEDEDISIKFFLIMQENMHEIFLYYTCAATLSYWERISV